jgi:hypothetical protein
VKRATWSPWVLAAGLLASAYVAAGCGGDDSETSPPGTGGSGATGGSGGQGGSVTSSAGAVLPCDPGELLAEDGSCLAPGIGVDECSAGFEHEDAACSAILPASPCGPGTHALPGETQCHAVGSCGSGSWGDIPVDANTQYVDQSFGGASDGSAGAPWTSIQQGIATAADGAIVAVAAGSYPAVTIDHAVQLWGVCADDVAIAGGSQPAVTVNAGLSAHIEGVSLSGGDLGLALNSTSAVTARRLWIHDTGAPGLQASGETTALTLEESLIENVVEFGVAAPLGQVTIVDSTIRDVASNSAGDWGAGLLAWGSFASPQAIVIQRSVIERTHSYGVAVQAVTDTSIEDCLIRDVELNSFGAVGTGIWQLWTDGDGARATMSIQGSVLERLHASGIAIWGGDASIDRTTVRDIDPPTTIGEWGAGIRFYSNGEGSNAPPIGLVTRSTVDRAHRAGIELWAAEAELERVLVRQPRTKTDGQHGFGVIAFDHVDTLEPSLLSWRGGRIEGASQGGVVISGASGSLDGVAVLDTQPTGTGSFGVGISVITDFLTGVPADAVLSRVVVDGAYAGGIVVGGGDLAVTDALVRNVKKQVNVDDFGDGIGAAATIVWLPGILPTSMSVVRATIEGVPRAGVSNFGASVTIEGTRLDCNSIDLDGEVVDDEPFAFDDQGGNECGCGAERWDCKVLTTNIDPPFAL